MEPVTIMRLARVLQDSDRWAREDAEWLSDWGRQLATGRVKSNYDGYTEVFVRPSLLRLARVMQRLAETGSVR
jgi:hypothetical protein